MYEIKFQYFDKKENIVTDKVLKCIEYDFNIIPSVRDRECRLQNYCTMIVTDADDVPEAHPRGF